MLEALKEIGEVLTSREGEVEFPIRRVPKEEDVEEPLLAKIIFDIDAGELDCDCLIRCDEERAREFLWVGNARGNKPQLMLTTDRREYLLERFTPHKWAIGAIVEEIERKELHRRPHIRELYDLLAKISEKFFSKRESLLQEFEELLRRRGCDPQQLVLYTVSVRRRGEVVDLTRLPGYREFLRHVLYESGSKRREKRDYESGLRRTGRCHVCGREGLVLADPAYPEGTLLKIYNTDKAGFMPNLSEEPENLLRAHAVCPDCKKKVVLGYNYVERNLSSKIGKLTVYLIPRVVGLELSYRTLDKVKKEVGSVFDAVKTLENLRKAEDVLKILLDDLARKAGGLYFLDIVFGSPGRSDFAYQYYIQDVPIMRLVELADTLSNVSSEVADIFHESAERWSIGFEDIYNMFPLRTVRGQAVEWKPLVELYNSMIMGTKYPRKTVVSKAVLFARIIRYGTYEGYSVRPPKDGEAGLCRNILKYSVLLRLGEQMGIIEPERGEKPDLSGSGLPEDIEHFVSVMGYTKRQTALFLLGVLVGRIGIEQYNKGDEKKSVLNKINFDGMSDERVKMLANYVLEGLRNYRILDRYTEAIYANMKRLLDESLKVPGDPVDNVFYILSGYAYITLRHITRGRASQQSERGERS